MNKFISQVVWMLLGVFSLVVAVASFVFGIIKLMDSHPAQGVFLFVITIVFGVVCVAAFKQV